MRVFDFHVRLSASPGAVDRLLDSMTACGITRGVACAGGVVDLDTLSRQVAVGGYVDNDADNEAVLRGCAESDGRLLPFYFANPRRPAKRYADHAGSFRGLEISPAVHGVGLHDDRVLELLDIADRVGHPVYVVCLERPGATVEDLVRVASGYRDLSFVLGHSGIGNIDLYGVSLIQHQKNIALEASGGYTCVLRTALERLGEDRVLFGSEYPLQHPLVELTKFRTLDLPESSWRKVAWENAERILGGL